MSQQFIKIFNRKQNLPNLYPSLLSQIRLNFLLDRIRKNTKIRIDNLVVYLIKILLA